MSDAMKKSYETDVLYGHEVAKENFLRAYKHDRLHHAWLFVGPEGIGKATCAYQLIRYLFAGGDRDFETVIKTPTQQNHLLKSLGHPDLLVIKVPEDKQSISVDAVRDISAFIHKTAAMSSHKAIMIDGVDDMTIQAANALLKNLEEPPKNVIFFLIARNKNSILPTIRSRCFVSDFNVLSLDMFVAHFGETMGGAYHQISEGRFGWALKLETLGGVHLYDQMLACLMALKEKTSDGLNFDLLFSRDGDAFFPIVRDLFCWWVHRLIKGIAIDEVPVFLSDTDRSAWQLFAVQDNLENLLDIMSKAPDSFREISKLNLDPKPILINTFFSISR